MTNVTTDTLTTKQAHHARIKKAQTLDAILRSEYPAIELFAVLDADTDKVTGWTAVGTGDITLWEATDLPEIADLLDAADEAGIDPEEGAQEKPSGSIVDPMYRQKYAEMSSNKQTCGDWLAEWLTTECNGVDGFRPAEFQAVIDANGVDQTGRWAKLPEVGGKGWAGRWRMNGRQALEKTVALNKALKDARGADAEIPQDEIDALRSKHSKWIAKQEKAAAATEELAK